MPLNDRAVTPDVEDEDDGVPSLLDPIADIDTDIVRPVPAPAQFGDNLASLVRRRNVSVDGDKPAETVPAAPAAAATPAAPAAAATIAVGITDCLLCVAIATMLWMMCICSGCY